MSHLKKFAVGVVMTLLTVAVGFFIVKRWAPDSAKDYFRV